MSASTEEEKDEWIKCIQQSISHNPFYDMLAARKKKAQKNSPWREVSLNDWVISGTDLTDEYCTYMSLKIFLFDDLKAFWKSCLKINF